MNEIGYTQALNASITRAAAQANTAVKAGEPTGNVLPNRNEQSTNSAVESQRKPDERGVKEAVDSVNSYVQNIQRDLQFSVDEDLDKTIIKVVESDSGKLIRQIPEDIFLELARNLKQDGELNLVNALG